jgi:hypothetical protein
MNMKDELQKIQETAWRRPLTPAEEDQLRALLATQPASRELWEQDVALTQLLHRAPNPVVASNFTARVLQAARATPQKRFDWARWLEPAQWLPESWPARLAVCSALVCASVVSFREFETMHRAQVAQQLANVSRVATLPRMEWLKDFDTINGINKVKVADDELLAALE